MLTTVPPPPHLNITAHPRPANQKLLVRKSTRVVYVVLGYSLDGKLVRCHVRPDPSSPQVAWQVHRISADEFEAYVGEEAENEEPENAA